MERSCGSGRDVTLSVFGFNAFPELLTPQHIMYVIMK